MDFFILNILNAMQLSMLIFILAIGLTLIFGLMDTLNLAHGGFYTIGAYAGSQLAINGSFWLAFLVSPLVAGIAGAILQRFALQPLASKGRTTHLDFALFTFGLLFVIMGGAEIIFGSAYLSIDAPAILKGGFAISGVTFPYYRVFVIFLGQKRSQLQPELRTLESFFLNPRGLSFNFINENPDSECFSPRRRYDEVWCHFCSLAISPSGRNRSLPKVSPYLITCFLF